MRRRTAPDAGRANVARAGEMVKKSAPKGEGPFIAAPSPDAIGRLSRAEQDVLGWIYIGKDDGHNARTIASLLKKGWIIAYKGEIPGNPNGSPIERLPLIVTRYACPSPAHHIAWCAWCAEQPDEEGDA